MKIKIIERENYEDTGRSFYVSAQGCFNHSSWFSSREINKITAAGYVNLDYEKYEIALARAISYKTLITDEPAQQQEAPRDWKAEPATEKQMNYLRDLGYFPEQRLTKSEASRMISAAKNSWAGSLNMIRADGSM